MEDIPGIDKAKREALAKGVQELIQLKEEVSKKRRQLKAMGLLEEPELFKQTIKYPDLQAKYKQQKEQKQTATKPAEQAQVPPPVPTQKASVPADSPFMDPKAPALAPKQEAPKQEPVKHQEAAPVPAVSAPIPVPVKAAVEVKPIRIGIDGKWLF